MWSQLGATPLPGPPARTSRPMYVDRLPPCNHACPAGEHVQAWLAEAQAGRYRAAWEILVRDNPLPAVHGRVCYHPHARAGSLQSGDGYIRRALDHRHDIDAAEGRQPVSFSVAPNESTAARTGTITVRDKVVRVTQAGR